MRSLAWCRFWLSYHYLWRGWYTARYRAALRRRDTHDQRIVVLEWHEREALKTKETKRQGA